MTELLVAQTTTVESIRPAAVLVIPILAMGLIFLSKNRPNVREAWSILAAISMFAIVASMVPGVLDGTVYETDFGAFVGLGDETIDLALQADALGMVFALVSSGLYVLTAIYSIGYMRGHHEPFQTRFFAMLCASVGAALGVAFAANIFVLLVFYEVLTLATYPLVAHDESAEARTSGYKYLAYALSGGLAVFGGMVAVFWLAGDISFTRGGIEGLATLAEDDPWAARAAFALLAGGFAVKAGVMPVHAWLPSAMVAPTPVSGLLHAVAVVKAGAFGVARTVIDVFGPETVAEIGMGTPLAILAGATIIISSLFALRQDNLKARLAYSTIAQLSYIVLGLSLLTQMGLMGGLLHIPAHAFAKLTLFLCAGALYVQLDVKYISEMPGIGRRMPITMSAFAVGSFSMAGIPILAGFVSKWHIMWGGAEAGNLFVPVVLIASGALNVAYFWPIIYTAFFETPDDHGGKPVLEHPFGGTPIKSLQYRPDGGHAGDGHDDDGDAHDDGHGHGHVELPPSDGWDRPAGRLSETTLLMLVPLMSTATLVLLFGIAPDHMVFFDLIQGIVENAGEVSS
ncbi:proton-conducting transporter transmembrane domain-containing protein [Natronolimnohabitans innermongolicus]|uniref:Monovalent cation/H+ antiporter subunit D n=1 Tax=Natronolimnohabitans innermongolicus JCM 12255 TaxID=1227499 RepID=L9WH26_9EURY|nr:proton-conducting transporter membrane subunit [Natronolimnohabitans innermongolicus]ELY48820.1 monovalent cation/H+ antiporter subunit D [Natronolimnohabitans innermongolicus JCM 12255]